MLPLRSPGSTLFGGMERRVQVLTCVDMGTANAPEHYMHDDRRPPDAKPPCFTTTFGIIHAMESPSTRAHEGNSKHRCTTKTAASRNPLGYFFKHLNALAFNRSRH